MASQLARKSNRLLTLVVAVSRNGVIGREQDLPWRLSNDLRRFKQVTMGHTLIMGRKTFESIGKCLPGRQTIVLTHANATELQTRFPDLVVASSIDQALAKTARDHIPFVVGGGQIYKACLPMADRVFITRVQATIEGDTYFQFEPVGDWVCSVQETQPADLKNDFPTVYEEWHRAACSPS